MNTFRKIILHLFLIISIFVSNFGHVNAAGASLFLATTQGTVLLNSIVSIDLFVSSPDQAVNTYDAVINYDRNYVKPLFINKSGSICTIYVRELAIGETSARITCGQPTPGFKASLGKIAMISFQMIKTGTTSVTVSSGSQVLANDGNGTNILSSTRGVTLNIVSGAGKLNTPTVTADGVANGDWTNKNTIKFNWTKIDNAKGYSFTFSTDKNATPDYISETSDLTTTFNNVADGTYYFKILATDGLVASDVQTYVVRIDTTGPQDLKISLNTCNPVSPNYLDLQLEDSIECLTYTDEDENIVLNASPIIGFEATDVGSGILHYTFSLDGADFITTTYQYPLDTISTGNHTLIVRAYDHSGNFTEKSMIFSAIDVAKPTLASINPSNEFPFGNNIEIYGTADPNVIILVYLNGKLLGSTFTDQDGKYEYVITQNLEFGDHEIITQAITSGGVLGSESDILVVKVIENLLAPVSNLGFSIVQFAPLCVIPLLALFIFVLFKRRKKEKEEEEIIESIEKTREEIQSDLEIIEKAARYGIERNDIVDGMRELDKKLEQNLDPDQLLNPPKEKKGLFGRLFGKNRSE